MRLAEYYGSWCCRRTVCNEKMRKESSRRIDTRSDDAMYVLVDVASNMNSNYQLRQSQ